MGCPAIKRWLSDDTNLRRVSHFIFKRFDKDKSGVISEANVIQALDQVTSYMGHSAPLTPEQSRQVIRWIDEDGSGDIDEEEFYRLVEWTCEMLGIREHSMDSDD